LKQEAPHRVKWRAGFGSAVR